MGLPTLLARALRLRPSTRLRHVMKTATQLGAVFALLVTFASGCQMFTRDHPMLHGHSPLKPAPASPDSVAMEIIWARFPANDPVLDESAWRAIDETQLEPAVRRELANNGLRAGIISGALPPAIDRVLHQGASPEQSAATEAAQNGSDAKQKSAALVTEPIVHGRTRRLRRHEKFEIQSSEMYPSMQLLLGGGSGRTFEQAQAVYALRVDPRSDRTATVELTPELHHGAPRLRYTGGDDGILRQASLKDCEVFDRLRISTKLAPGEMLVLMSMPNAGSQLGHYFHTVDSSDGPQQKLILLRLAEVPSSDTFSDIATP